MRQRPACPANAATTFVRLRPLACAACWHCHHDASGMRQRPACPASGHLLALRAGIVITMPAGRASDRPVLPPATCLRCVLALSSRCQRDAPATGLSCLRPLACAACWHRHHDASGTRQRPACPASATCLRCVLASPSRCQRDAPSTGLSCTRPLACAACWHCHHDANGTRQRPACPTSATCLRCVLALSSLPAGCASDRPVLPRPLACAACWHCHRDASGTRQRAACPAS